MRGLVYMASRDVVDVDTFHKGIQYALERLGKSKFGFESTTVSNFKSKSHAGSGNELVESFPGALSIQQKLPVQIFGIFAGRMERVRPLPRIRCHVPCNTGHAG